MKKILLTIGLLTLLLSTGCTQAVIDSSIFSGIGNNNVSFDDYASFEREASNLGSGMHAIDKSEEMDVRDVKKIETSVVFADVKVVRENRETVKIHYFGILNDSRDADYNIRKNNTFKFEVNWHNDLLNLNPFKNSKAMMIIYLPEEYKGELMSNTVSGDIETDALKLSEVKLSTVSGDIDVEELEGNDLTIASVSGDIRLNKATLEQVDLDNVSGSLRINELESEKVDANTISGDIRIDLEEMKDNIKIESVSGSVILNIKEDLNAELNVESLTGDVNCSHKVDDVDEKDDNVLKGKIGSGKYELRIETLSGDISID